MHTGTNEIKHAGLTDMYAYTYMNIHENKHTTITNGYAYAP